LIDTASLPPKQPVHKTIIGKINITTKYLANFFILPLLNILIIIWIVIPQVKYFI